MSQVKGRLLLTDEDIRLLVSSLDRRIKRLWQVRHRDEHPPQVLQGIDDSISRLSQLRYKLRMLRKEANGEGPTIDGGR